VDLNAVLGRAVELGASDIHLKVGQPPVLRRDGELGLLPDHAPLYDSDLDAALALVADMTPAKLSHFHETGELDLAYATQGLPRFRVNGYRQRGSISFAFRVIPSEVPSFAQLRLPKGVQRLAEEHRGLVLVTGATGSGKTTTLAAVIDYSTARAGSTSSRSRTRSRSCTPTTAASSTSARSGSTPSRSSQRSVACSARTRT
jgi:twitching motility protein PilT